MAITAAASLSSRLHANHGIPMVVALSLPPPGCFQLPSIPDRDPRSLPPPALAPPETMLSAMMYMARSHTSMPSSAVLASQTSAVASLSSRHLPVHGSVPRLLSQHRPAAPTDCTRQDSSSLLRRLGLPATIGGLPPLGTSPCKTPDAELLSLLPAIARWLLASSTRGKCSRAPTTISLLSSRHCCHRTCQQASLPTPTGSSHNGTDRLLPVSCNHGIPIVVALGLPPPGCFQLPSIPSLAEIQEASHFPCWHLPRLYSRPRRTRHDPMPACLPLLSWPPSHRRRHLPPLGTSPCMARSRGFSPDADRQLSPTAHDRIVVASSAILASQPSTVASLLSALPHTRPPMLSS